MTRHEYNGHLDRIIRRRYIIGYGGHTGRGILIGPYRRKRKSLIDAFTGPLKPKRQPIVKIRRIRYGPNPITGRTFSIWHWQCGLCDHNLKPRDVGSTHYGELCLTWERAIKAANHHAHNHH